MHNIKKILILLILTNSVLTALTKEQNLSTEIQINETNSTININALLKNEFKKYPSRLLKNIPQKKFLKNFYRKNSYKTLWLENNNFNKVKYTQLFNHIKNDITLEHTGLIYKNYEILNKIVDNNLTLEQRLHTEVKLSSLYYNFLLHAIYGEIQWKNFSYKLSSLKKKKINASWIRYKPKFNIIELMKKSNINASLQKVKPKNFGYAGLLLALEKLETLKKNGTWEKLPSFKRLAVGSTGDIVIKLRKRLQVSEDYVDCNETNQTLISSTETKLSKDLNLSRDAVFGLCLDKAVKNFQKRHGLLIDGIVGGGTRKALNVTIDEKIRKVRLNIDRIKWLPREEKQRFIIVNIPEFMLHYVEENQTKKQLRVIVGDKKHPTPIFSENISYIVLNPYWKVPEGIVRREIVPAMIKNPNYLKKQGLVAHRTWDENSRIMNTSLLYWEDYLYGEKFPYRLMQPPGPRNALGKIKFKFPNRFAVYLHDTPTRYLFKRNVRAFSHGCVRLSQPRELLETIATFNPNIDIRKAKKILKGKRKKQLQMKEKLRIHIIYLTAGINENAQIEFRNDIYKYDKYQKRRLR